MSHKILVINPGSTSTKIGVFEDEKLLFDKTLRHSAEEIAQFPTIADQKDFRKKLVLEALAENHFDMKELSAVCGRGGLMKSIPGGTYQVTTSIVVDLVKGVQGQHASNLGGILAREIADELDIPAYIVDPPVVDEMSPVAKYSGHPLIQLVDLAVRSAEQAGLVRRGDLVVVTAGVPVGISGTTNMIRVQQVGGSLVNAVGIGTQQTSGPLCVCRTTDEVPQKFRSGDVLVVPYTTNDMLPYLREAAAIISEEASPDCHTATVGLLLGKPVLLDATDATRRLKDGVMVSVDCARGVVQTLPQ